MMTEIPGFRNSLTAEKRPNAGGLHASIGEEATTTRGTKGTSGGLGGSALRTGNEGPFRRNLFESPAGRLRSRTAHRSTSRGRIRSVAPSTDAMETPEKTADPQHPLDQVKLRKIAQAAELKVRKVFKRARRVCPPKDVLIDRLVDSFVGLGSRVLAPQQGKDRQGRFDVAGLGIVARRFFLQGDAIADCTIAEKPCQGRFHGQSETLKVWKDGEGHSPRRSAMKPLVNAAGSALLWAVRTATAAKRAATLPPAESAKFMDEIRRYEKSEPSGVGSWLVFDGSSAALSVTCDAERATTLASSPVETWRPAFYVFRRDVLWRWSIVRCRQVGRSALVITDGSRWIAGFVSPAGATPAPVAPPRAARAPWKPKTAKTAAAPGSTVRGRPVGVNVAGRKPEEAPPTRNPSLAGDDPLKFLDDIKEEPAPETRRRGRTASVPPLRQK